MVKDPILTIRGLEKSFGDNHVLRGIDLDVMQGDCIAILGASGSGKSTFLRCLNFMEKPTGGEITHAGMTIGTVRAGKPRQYHEGELTGGASEGRYGVSAIQSVSPYDRSGKRHRRSAHGSAYG